MATTQRTAGQAGGPGDYILAADDYWQPKPTEAHPDAEVHYARGDVVTLDAGTAERLWRAGALAAVGEALPSRDPAPSPIQVLYAQALDRAAAELEARRASVRRFEEARARRADVEAEGEQR